MTIDLLAFAKKGLFVGPDEDEKSFAKRMQIFQEFEEDPQQFIQKHQMNFPYRLKIEELPKLPFGFSVKSLPIFCSRKRLSLWQGASTWIFEDEFGFKLPLIQLKKTRFCSKEELLAHELVHFARVAYDEPKYEEIFAYMTSKNKLRRILGPLFRNRSDPYIFIVLAILAPITWTPLAIYCFHKGLLLWKDHRFLRNCLNKLRNTCKKDSLAIALHLTDKEIYEIAKTNDLKEYFSLKKESSLRWQQIYLEGLI